ncbi:hypothetical protein JRQ81_011494 [Phrynocephalus forsythii]|uniref:Apolipoprotein A-I n=1 Tax=Phrynocephalus forsythii TaxID=171643 RepID=A0A9Q0X6V0_9SAUR|nr:hypothetical protein JRQ81_011494 [Phrynocephalus forsythii]
MSYYGDPVLERLGRYLKEFEPTFENVLKPLYVEVSTEYENYLDDQLYRYIKNWEDAHPTLRSFADQVMTRFRQGMEALNKNLKPRLKPILEEIEKYKTEFRQWVDTPIIPPNA